MFPAQACNTGPEHCVTELTPLWFNVHKLCSGVRHAATSAMANHLANAYCEASFSETSYRIWNNPL